MTNDPKHRLWYLKNGNETVGPFPSGLIRRHLILGRLRESDEISPDGDFWGRVDNFPELIPDELVLAAAGNPETLIQARLREDERQPGDRRQRQGQAPDDRRNSDRRRTENELAVHHRLQRASLKTPSRKPSQLVVTLVGFLLLVGVLLAYYTLPGTQLPIQSRSCNDTPKPAVNWSNCALSGLQAVATDLRQANISNAQLVGADFRGANLEQSNMAYSDLRMAKLQKARLGAANLIGASLRGADLSEADLRGADLSYVDLTDARLDSAVLTGARLAKAIWIDGKVCAADSMGRC